MIIVNDKNIFFEIDLLEDHTKFSNPIFDDEEKKWTHPPIMNESEIYIDIYELAFFFGYKMQKKKISQYS